MYQIIESCNIQLLVDASVVLTEIMMRKQSYADADDN